MLVIVYSADYKCTACGLEHVNNLSGEVSRLDKPVPTTCGKGNDLSKSIKGSITLRRRMKYDPMCSCATCNYERDNERKPMYRVIAVCGSAVLYVSTYFVGSLPLVLGTSMALAGVLVAISQMRDK